MKKGIQNADAVTRKLRPTLIRATNNGLKIARKKKQKEKEIIERWKAEAMAGKRCKTRKKISLSIEEEDKSDIKDDTDPDQTNNKYPLQL